MKKQQTKTNLKVGGLQVGHRSTFRSFQSLSTQRHCPSSICYTSAPLILLHLIEHFKKAGQSTFVIRLSVLSSILAEIDERNVANFATFSNTKLLCSTFEECLFFPPSSKHSIKQTLCVPLIVERLNLSQEPLWSQRFLSRADRNLRQ